MTSFNIPWKFLDLDSEPTKDIIDQSKAPTTHKSFAQALTNLCDIPLSQFPQPVVKGDRLAIEIPEVAYQAGLDACKHNLHGRIIWPKGSTPLSVVALKTKLTLIWKDFSKWGVISLGKGFFEFTFSTLEDVRRVRSIPLWNINPGMLKLFAWTKDFNPRLQHNTSAQVWVKFFGLSQEYWHKNILFAIASSIGTPICTDSVTARPMHEKTFGQFARVLVDMDLSQSLRYKVLVERKGFAFFVEMEYENLPDFCNACQIIGHHVDNCKRWNKEEELKSDKDNISKKKSTVEQKKNYVPTKDGRKQQSKDNEIIADREVINVDETSVASQQRLDKGKVIEGSAVVTKKPVLRQEHGEVIGNSVTVMSPRATYKAQDQLLEADLNAVVENDTDKEFSDSESVFDATQMQPVQASASNTSVEQRPTPERILQDMEFLKTSWANMAEEDESSQKNLEDSEKKTDDHDDGFKITLSKHQKKAQKKKNQSSKDSYATRSRVSTKPFR
jgi:hypothetical protein